MKEGDIVLAAVPQADGAMKERPVLLLRRMPPFDDFLVCGISTQLQQAAAELDEQITPSEPDYRTSGLKSASLIRLGFLAVLPRAKLKGRLGSISNARIIRLLNRLSDFLRPTTTQPPP
jgi:mRNA interferase MazF